MFVTSERFMKWNDNELIIGAKTARSHVLTVAGISSLPLNDFILRFG
jgi:hypothetical protein